jgi:hypothetical protein
MRRVVVHNHFGTKDAVNPSVVKALAKAKQLDKLGYLKGIKSIALVPDSDKWNASYEYPSDKIRVRRKFEKKTFADQVQTFLHEAGHRGQYKVDTKTYKAFKASGLGSVKNFLAMANKVHREDYAKNGIDDPVEEAFAESYARFILGLKMPPAIRKFWQQRIKSS